MRAYVISLAASTDRREEMQPQLEASGLDYEFFDAVDGRALAEAQRSELVDEAEVLKHPTWLVPGVIGSALSHKGVYERIAARHEEAALVLEDDAILPPDINELIDALAGELRSDEVMLLDFRSFGPCQLSRPSAVTVGEHRILQPLKPGQIVSALAYLIGADAAASLAAAIVPVRLNSDSWGDHMERGALRSLRVVLPRPVAQRLSGHSTIGFAGISTLRQRLTRQTFWPIPQLRIANRKRVRRRMQRVEFVD
jgi:glycosyl transferase, family 25